MKKRQIRKLGKVVAAIISSVAVLAGCGNKVETSTTQPAQAQTSETGTENTQVAEAPEETVEATTILIGTGGSPKPWLWVEEDGRIAGYDAEVIYAIDELLPQYDFEFEKTEFASLFTGVDSGRYVMAVNNFAWREERAEKYLYGEEYVCYEKKVIIVKKGNDTIQSLADIGGHSTYTSGTGLASQLFLEDYNEKHPDNPVELVFSDADTLKTIQDIVAGVVDFGFLDQPMLSVYLESYPSLYEDLDIIELSDEETESINPPYTYFIFAKTEQGEEVRAAVDEALRVLKENGTITELSLQYIGYDVTGR